MGVAVGNSSWSVGRRVSGMLVGDTAGIPVGLSFGELVGEAEFKAAKLCWS